MVRKNEVQYENEVSEDSADDSGSEQEIVEDMHDNDEVDESRMLPPHLRFNIHNEQTLHWTVVRHIRQKHPHMIINDFGKCNVFEENGIRIDKRTERSRYGYTNGCCDLMVLNAHKKYRGLCIELKTPKGGGRLTKHQLEWLCKMKANGYKVLISNDYLTITNELWKYAQGFKAVEYL